MSNMFHTEIRPGAILPNPYDLTQDWRVASVDRDRNEAVIVWESGNDTVGTLDGAIADALKLGAELSDGILSIRRTRGGRMTPVMPIAVATDTGRVHGPAPAIPATDDPTVRGATYDTPAAYYRVVASEALGVLYRRECGGLTERDAIDIAFGLTPFGDTPGISGAEPTPDEIAVVSAILAAIR